MVCPRFENLCPPWVKNSKKILKRGYNQSEQIAIGLAESLNLPVITDVLIKNKFSESQTSKSRLKRFENTEDVFITKGEKNKIEKVILVDDTITTGATLIACASALQKMGVKKINILGIAYAG